MTNQCANCLTDDTTAEFIGTICAQCAAENNKTFLGSPDSSMARQYAYAVSVVDRFCEKTGTDRHDPTRQAELEDVFTNALIEWEQVD